MDSLNGLMQALLSRRQEWDALNAKQGALWIAAGRKMTPEQQAIIDRMKPLTPPGYEGA